MVDKEKSVIEGNASTEKGFDPKEFEKQYSQKVDHAEGVEKEVEAEPAKEVEVDPEGFARSVGTIIAGMTGQDESFVENYANMAGTLLKVTGANKLQSFETTFANMPFLLKAVVFGGIMAVPAIALIMVNKKIKQAEQKNAVDKIDLEKEMLNQKFEPEEPDFVKKPGPGVDRFATYKKEVEEIKDKKEPVPVKKPEKEPVPEFTGSID